MQQPSSLIFLAIVVIWAAYLLQHWIRRREALATARSVDQFSDAMRVLERREHRVEGFGGIDDAERTQRSTMQASEAPHASRISAPLVRASAPRPSLRAGTVMTGETQQPTAPTSERRDEGTASGVRRLTAAGNSSGEAMQRLGNFAAHAGSPKLRAIALIGSLSLLLITVVCAPFGALPWWSPVLMLAISGGVFWWCRASAMAAGAVRRDSTRSAQHPARAQAARRPEAGVKLPQRKSAAPAAPAVPVTKATMPDPVAPTEPQPRPATVEQVFDVAASVASTPQHTGAAPELIVEQSPTQAPAARTHEAGDGWQPVAVPRPTYTMKERAPERPAPAPAPTGGRSYDDVANEDLPFDGLALDQDLDDLPSVFRAG